jgi:hypothetical protein
MAGRGRKPIPEEEKYPIDKHKYQPKPGIIEKQYKDMMAERLEAAYLAVFKMASDTPKMMNYEKQGMNKAIAQFLELL